MQKVWQPSHASPAFHSSARLPGTAATTTPTAVIIAYGERVLPDVVLLILLLPCVVFTCCYSEGYSEPVKSRTIMRTIKVSWLLCKQISASKSRRRRGRRFDCQPACLPPFGVGETHHKWRIIWPWIGGGHSVALQECETGMFLTRDITAPEEGTANDANQN